MKHRQDAISRSRLDLGNPFRSGRSTNWHKQYKDGLRQHRVGADVEGPLGPPLRRAVYWVELHGTHPCAQEEDTEHWRKLHGASRCVGGGHDGLVLLIKKHKPQLRLQKVV